MAPWTQSRWRRTILSSHSRARFGSCNFVILKLVTYSVLTNALVSTSTNSLGMTGEIIGFNRVEAPLVEMRLASTNREPLSFNGAMDPIAMATNNFVEPLTRAIRFVQFRYF